MNEILLKKVFKKHKKTLKNLKIPNKKFVIGFSGVPSSGKTFLSKIIEKRYKGVRISNDELRDMLKKMEIKISEKEKTKFIKEFSKIKSIDFTKGNYKFRKGELEIELTLFYYIQWILKNYPFENKLIILESSLDRKYPFIFKILKNKKFPRFIIQIDLDEKLVKKRYKEKPSKDKEYLNKNLPRWIKDNQEFSKTIKPDFIFKDNLKELLKELDKIL